MVYVTPVFAVVFACGVTALLGGISGRMGWSGKTHRILVVTCFAALAVPNLLAIRVECFRGRLANTYLLYDDSRTADLIWRNATASGRLNSLSPDQIAVRGVVEMPHRKLAPQHSHMDPGRFQIFRDLLGNAFGNAAWQEIQVNPPRDQIFQAAYRIQGHLIFDEKGRWIDPFGTKMALGLKRLQQGRTEEAQELLLQAVHTRPFLLKYLLPSLPLSDLRRATGGLPLRPWVHQIDDWYVRKAGGAVPKQRRTQQIIEQETWETISCFFALSFLEHQRGNAAAGRDWLSQIHFLESDPGMIIRQLERIPQLASVDGISAHLKRFRDAAYFVDPMPWVKDDYSFGRFLARLVLGWDVKSSWERRLPRSI